MITAWPRHGRYWQAAEVAADVAAARDEFRSRRLGEPLARYLSAFDAAQAVHAELIAGLEGALALDAVGVALLARLWATDAGRTAYRYLAAPPISEDDLETLAGAKLVSRSARQGDLALARLADVMRTTLDPRRFPWVAQARAPTQAELSAAILASTTLAATQRVHTLRRGDEKSMVEGSVRGLLVGMGWQAAPYRPGRGVQNLINDAPPVRCFKTQTNLGADNADVLVRLDDGRLLAIECKGSNSEINSRKRLNKEAAQNARAWLTGFGGQVVPAVALQGVFKDRYVLEAQDTPMLIFWGHRLDDLCSFIRAAV